MSQFDVLPDRRINHAYKWEGLSAGELPMWVADMDFDTAEPVKQALRERLEQGAYGYNVVTPDFAESIISWWKRRHDTHIEADWILFSTGVVPTISSSVRKLTHEGDGVVVMSPVYNIFYNSIVNNARRVVDVPLLYDEDVQETQADQSANAAYSINFAALEAALAEPSTTMMIFCNPHNPVGRIWSLDELTRVAELCARYDVMLLSDEIHCDLAHEGHAYVSMLRVRPDLLSGVVVCVAATKAFNLAGLQTSAIVVPDAELRARVNRGINTDEVAEPNTFAVAATVAAFSHDGERWLDELRAYLAESYARIEAVARDELSALGVRLVPSEATYLAWLDCRSLTSDSDALAAFLREKTGLVVSSGAVYGAGGRGFLRVNYACPHAMLEDGLSRLVQGVQAWTKTIASE